MKKIISALLLAGVLFGLIGIFWAVPAGATGSTIATGVNSSPLSYQRHSFYALGMEWVFYQDGGGWEYKTGNITGNVTVWSGATALEGNSYDDLYYDKTLGYCHGVGVTVSPFQNAIVYRRGQPLGNGSIIWTAEVTVIDSYCHFVSASVCDDANGYAYIGAYWNNRPVYSYSGVFLMHGSTNDGSYGSNTMVSRPPDDYLYPCGVALMPVSGDRVVAIWSQPIQPLHANVCEGGTWSDTVTSINRIAWAGAFSAVAQGTEVSVAYLSVTNQPNNQMSVDTFNVDTNTWTDGGSLFIAGPYAFPVLTLDGSGSIMYMAYEVNSDTYGGNNTILYRTFVSGVWSPPQIVATYASLKISDTFLSYLFTDYETASANYGVYWFTSGDYLKFSDEVNPIGIPTGVALSPTDITATSATLNGQCISNGNVTTTAIFYYAGGGIANDNPEPVNGGTVGAGESFNVGITGLYPDTVYWYWISLANTSGAYQTNVVYFQTLEASGTNIPVVETLAATAIGQTSATINGVLLYDGNLGCYLGFRWRLQGAGSWTTSELSGVHHSIMNFEGSLHGLIADTTYEFEAYARNPLAPDGIFGNDTTFTTLHAAGVTPMPTGGIHLPTGIGDFFGGLSSTIKLILAIIITVGAVIVVAWQLGRSGAVTYACMATGVGLVILFTFIGWFPMWVIVLIGAIVGLLIFFVLLGRR